MPTTDTIARLMEQLDDLDRVLAARQKRPVDCAGVSLHANEAQTLKMIARNEGISQTALSEQMFRTKGATSVMVDKLVEKGLVCRRRVDGDQRRCLLTLTDQGRAAYAARMAQRDAQVHAAARQLDLSDAALDAANETLAQLLRFYSAARPGA